ncbi:MAG: hypothetical protein K2W82_04735 [Candidatus Obscuribacterales bacterium]|nr:hypothetical protein [Candidatus Obscuribacterales bacterium]
MGLYFPNARLLVYNHLLESKNDCYGAMVNAARDLGLLKNARPEDFKQGESIKPDSCGALQAARQILDYSLTNHSPNAQHSAKNVNKIWSDIAKQVEQYKTTMVSRCEEPNKSEKLICAQLPPIVLDILLQHLMPHL